MCFNHDSYEMTEKGRAFMERHGDFSGKYSKIEGELEKVILTGNFRENVRFVSESRS